MRVSEILECYNIPLNEEMDLFAVNSKGEQVRLKVDDSELLKMFRKLTESIKSESSSKKDDEEEPS